MAYMGKIPPKPDGTEGYASITLTLKDPDCEIKTIACIIKNNLQLQELQRDNQSGIYEETHKKHKTMFFLYFFCSLSNLSNRLVKSQIVVCRFTKPKKDKNCIIENKWETRPFVLKDNHVFLPAYHEDLKTKDFTLFLNKHSKAVTLVENLSVGKYKGVQNSNATVKCLNFSLSNSKNKLNITEPASTVFQNLVDGPLLFEEASKSWRLIGWYKTTPEKNRIIVYNLTAQEIDTSTVIWKRCWKTFSSNQPDGNQPDGNLQRTSTSQPIPSGSDTGAHSFNKVQVADSSTPNPPVAKQPEARMAHHPPFGPTVGLPSDRVIGQQGGPTNLVLEVTTAAMAIRCVITVSGYDGDVAPRLLKQFKGGTSHLLASLQDVICPRDSDSDSDSVSDSDIIVDGISLGSIIIQLRVKTIKALEELWERYKNGDLKKALERVFITDEIRKLGKTIEMVVTMSTEQYLDAQSFLYELTRHQEKGNPVGEDEPIKEREDESEPRTSGPGTRYPLEEEDLSLMNPHEEERDNFFQLTLLLFRDGNQKMREFFKSQWPVVYQNKKGTPPPSSWTDIPNDATEMKNLETEPWEFQFNNQKVNFNSGDTNTWDFSLLTTVLNRSTLKFVSPSTPESNAIKELKEIRNGLCHAPDAKIPTAVFIAVWPKACNALETFGVTQDDIDQVKKDVKKPVDELLPFLKESLKGEKGILDAINKCRKVNICSFSGSIEHLQLGDENVMNIGKAGAIINSVLEATTTGINIRSEITASGYDGDVAVRIMDKFRSGNQHLLADLQDAICTRNSSIHNIGFKGSIIIEQRVKTIEALEELWERYKNGDLKNALERVLITDEIRKLVGEDEPVKELEDRFDEITIREVSEDGPIIEHEDESEPRTSGPGTRYRLEEEVGEDEPVKELEDKFDKIQILEGSLSATTLETEIVTQEVIVQLKLAQRISTNWKFVGRYLSMEEYVLESIENDYRKTEERSYQMLIKWLQTGENTCTADRLVTALKDAQRTDLADTVRDYYMEG